MMGQAWPLALARLLSGGGDKGQFAAALGRWRASLPAIPGADVIFSCRSGAAGELDQDERGADVLDPGPAVAWLVTVSLLVLPGGQKSFSLEGQESSREAILGLGECVSSPWGCVCESLLFLESKVTAAAG